MQHISRWIILLLLTLTSHYCLVEKAFSQALPPSQEVINSKPPVKQAPSIQAETATGKKILDLPSKSLQPFFSVNIADNPNEGDLAPAMRVVAILTLLTFAPAILLLMSSFTRIMIVLSFLRQALGAPTLPPNQVLIGLSLFLTYFVMAPTTQKIYDDAIKPYNEKLITSEQAFEKAEAPIRKFMLAQVRTEDMGLFYSLANEPKPEKAENVSLRILIPSFVISELRAAFQIGFVVYLPFIIIDMIVSSVLMAMGMMMLPPTVVSLPLKIILFVLVDGWNLLAGSLVRSFA